MGVDPTKGKGLLVFLDGIAEGVIVEATVVGVIVLNADPVGVGECLKGLFRFDGFTGG